MPGDALIPHGPLFPGITVAVKGLSRPAATLAEL